MCGSTSRFNATPGVGLGGLVPTTPKVTMEGLPLSDMDFLDFRLRGQRMGFKGDGPAVCPVVRADSNIFSGVALISTARAPISTVSETTRRCVTALRVTAPTSLFARRDTRRCNARAGCLGGGRKNNRWYSYCLSSARFGNRRGRSARGGNQSNARKNIRVSMNSGADGARFGYGRGRSARGGNQSNARKYSSQREQRGRRRDRRF